MLGALKSPPGYPGLACILLNDSGLDLAGLGRLRLVLQELHRRFEGVRSSPLPPPREWAMFGCEFDK